MLEQTNKNAYTLSFCLSTYNRAQEIENNVKTLLACESKRFEVIVVDDNSTDDTYERLSKINDSRFKYIRNTENCGGPQAWFQALECGSGEFLYCLNDYDTVFTSSIKTIINVLKSPLPDHITAELGIIMVGRKNSGDDDLIYYNCGEEALNRFAYIPFHPSEVIFSRKAWQSSANRREYFYDDEFYKRIYAHGYVVADFASCFSGLFIDYKNLWSDNSCTTAKSNAYKKAKSDTPKYWEPAAGFKMMESMVAHLATANIKDTVKVHLFKTLYGQMSSRVTFGYRDYTKIMNENGRYGQKKKHVSFLSFKPIDNKFKKNTLKALEKSNFSLILSFYNDFSKEYIHKKYKDCTNKFIKLYFVSPLSKLFGTIISLPYKGYSWMIKKIFNPVSHDLKQFIKFEIDNHLHQNVKASANNAELLKINIALLGEKSINIEKQVKQLSIAINTLSEKSDLLDVKADMLNEKSDTLNEKSDTLNQKADTLCDKTGLLEAKTNKISIKLDAAALLQSKFLLVNDTFNSYHHGSTITSLVIRKKLEALGNVDQLHMLAIMRQNSLCARSYDYFKSDEFYCRWLEVNSDIALKIEKAGCIVVNGEGCLSHFNTGTLQLLYIIYVASQKFHKKVALINTSIFYETYVNNYSSEELFNFKSILREVLSKCEFCVIRERKSLKQVAQLGVTNADLGFDSVPIYVKNNYVEDKSALTKNKYIVISGGNFVDERYVEFLQKAKTILDNKYPDVKYLFLSSDVKEKDTTGDWEIYNKIKLVFGDSIEMVCTEYADTWLTYIKNAQFVLSGRFHHSITAYSFAVPFVCFKTNTSKLEGALELMHLPQVMLDLNNINASIENFAKIAGLDIWQDSYNKHFKTILTLAENNFNNISALLENKNV